MIRDRRMTYAEIAAETGLTVSGVQQAARKYGLSKKTISHKWALPWRVGDEHHKTKVAKYLRDLSSVAQGKEISSENRNTAIAWARSLVERDLDIDYDREKPPNEENVAGGFFTKPADPENWHVRMVLERALRGTYRRL